MCVLAWRSLSSGLRGHRYSTAKTAREPRSRLLRPRLGPRAPRRAPATLVALAVLDGTSLLHLGQHTNNTASQIKHRPRTLRRRSHRSSSTMVSTEAPPGQHGELLLIASMNDGPTQMGAQMPRRLRAAWCVSASVAERIFWG